MLLKDYLKKTGKFRWKNNQPNLRAMGDQIAEFTNGVLTTADSSTWVTMSGEKYVSPKWMIVYDNEEELNDAWEFLQNKGSFFKAKLPDDSEYNEYIKLGKFAVAKYIGIEKNWTQYALLLNLYNTWKKGNRIIKKL